MRSADYGGEESVSAKVQIGLRPVERCEDEKGVKRGTGDRDNCKRAESALNYLTAKHLALSATS